MDLDELLSGLGSEDADVDGLKAQLTEYMSGLAEEKKKLANKNKELLGKVKGLKDTQMPEDFDAELYQTMLKEHEEAASLQEKSRTDFENMKNELLNKHQTDLEKLTSESQKYRTALEQQMIDNAAIMAINAEKGNAELLLPHVKAQLKMIEGEDGFKTEVYDGKDTRYNDSGDPMTIKQLINEMKTKDTFAPAFMQENKGSNLSFRDTNGTSVPNPFKKGSPHYNLTAQAQMRKNDPDRAAAMAKAAGQG